MAFFKFRQRGPAEPKAARAADPAAAGAATETVESLRRRARHRLLGAVVLVALAVIGFPLLFDTEPRPVTIDAPITIPDRDSAPPLQMPAQAAPQAPAPPATPATPAAQPGATAAGTVQERAEDTATQAREQAEQQARREAEQQARREAEAQARREAEARARQEDEARARARQEEQARAKREAAEREAARARAALEGRESAPAAKAPAAASESGRFIVQIGAFADGDAVREARQKAERAGLKTYTQVVDTKDGKRTRVRVGPFASRAEAEKAVDTLKKAGLPGGIFSL